MQDRHHFRPSINSNHLLLNLMATLPHRHPQTVAPPLWPHLSLIYPHNLLRPPGLAKRIRCTPEVHHLHPRPRCPITIRASSRRRPYSNHPNRILHPNKQQWLANG